MAIVDMDGSETGLIHQPNISFSGGNPEIGVGRDGIGLCLQRNNSGLSSTATMTRMVTTGSDELFFHLGRGLFWAGSGTLITFWAGATAHIIIGLDATGHLTAQRGATVLQTSTQQCSVGFAWHSIQGRVLISDTVGVIEIKVDGEVWLSVTAADTKNGGATTRVTQVDFVIFSNIPTFDDWVLCDTTGSVNNSWTGEVSIVGVRPAGDGEQSQLIGSDGNSVANYQQVDEVWSAISTADYNGGVTAGDRDLYDGAAVGKLGAVMAAQSLAYAAKSDAGAKSFKHVRRSATPTVDSSSAVALSTTYALYVGPVWETDADGAAWSVASVDAHQFGFEVV